MSSIAEQISEGQGPARPGASVEETSELWTPDGVQIQADQHLREGDSISSLLIESLEEQYQEMVSNERTSSNRNKLSGLFGYMKSFSINLFGASDGNS